MLPSRILPTIMTALCTGKCAMIRETFLLFKDLLNDLSFSIRFNGFVIIDIQNIRTEYCKE